MFDGLGLGAVRIGGDEEDGRVHNCGSCEHCWEEDFVAGAVAEGDVALEGQAGFAVFVVAFGVVFFVGGVGFEAIWGWAGRAFEDLGVCVAQPDCYVSHPLLSEFDCVDSRYGPNNGGLAVGDVPNSSNIEGGLPAHDLRGVRGEFRDVLVVLRFEFGILGV